MICLVIMDWKGTICHSSPKKHDTTVHTAFCQAKRGQLGPQRPAISQKLLPTHMPTTMELLDQLLEQRELR